MSETMSVTIEAAGSLKKHIGAGTTLQDVYTVGEAVTQLALPEIGEVMMLVNGRLAYWQTELEDGDILKLVPAIGGG